MMHPANSVYKLIKKSVVIFLFYPFSVLIADDADTLFRSDEVVKMELRSDFKEIQKDRIEKPEPHDSELIYHNPDGSEVKLPVVVSVRGNFRKNPVNCSFPPLLLDFRKGDDAIKVAMSNVNKKLKENKLEYVKVEIGMSQCPKCGDYFESSFFVGDVSLVGIYLTVDVFNAENPKHAENIAKSVAGKALKDVPFKTFEVKDRVEKVRKKRR